MATLNNGAAPKRRWPPVAVVFAVLLVLVAGVSVYFALRPSPGSTGRPTTPVTTSPSASAAVSGAPTTLADGCLGGTDPVKAVRIAHQVAPLTPEGAAAFVATMMRWQGQIPHDPAEFRETGKQIWAPSLPATNRNVPAPPAGATAWLSTADARYRVLNVSKSDMTIEAVFTQTGVLNGISTEVQQVGQFTVTAIDGHWALKSAGPPANDPKQTIADLQAKGLPYRGGC